MDFGRLGCSYRCQTALSGILKAFCKAEKTSRATQPRNPQTKVRRVPPLTEKEASSSVFRWLFWICDFHSKSAAARIYKVTLQTIRNNETGHSLPMPTTWARLCRDADWSVQHRFIWSLVIDRRGHDLKLMDKNYVPEEELPGPLDELPGRYDLLDDMSMRNHVGRANFSRLIGWDDRAVKERETWRRLAEVKLWHIVGYPVSMMRDADWKEREGVEWDRDFTFRARHGWRNLSLPANSFDFVRTPPA